jgi:dynein heavy chain 2
LEILGQATNPLVIQTHLKKLFAGIHQVKFDDKNEYIAAMRSLDGEIVPLVNKVKTSHQVEVVFSYSISFSIHFIIKCSLVFAKIEELVGRAFE